MPLYIFQESHHYHHFNIHGYLLKTLPLPPIPPPPQSEGEQIEHSSTSQALSPYRAEVNYLENTRNRNLFYYLIRINKPKKKITQFTRRGYRYQIKHSNTTKQIITPYNPHPPPPTHYYYYHYYTTDRISRSYKKSLDRKTHTHTLKLFEK